MAQNDVNTNLSGTVIGTLKDRLHTDADEGTVSIYGRKIFVGEEAAKYVDGLVAQAQNAVSQYGGAYARRYGAQLASLVVADHQAAKVGKVAEALLRFGLPVADIGLGVKTAVRDGYKRMHDLRDESAAVLAANNNAKVGVSQVMTTKFSALSNERSLIFEEGRKTVISSLTGVIKNLPTIIINIWQQKKEQIENPLSLISTLPPQKSADNALPGSRVRMGTPEERSRIAREIIELRHMRNPELAAKLSGTSPSGSRHKSDAVGDRLSRLFKPQTLKDLDDNLKLSILAPFLGGIGSQLIGGDLERNTGKKTAWRRIKELENHIKEEEPTSAGDISQYVREIFQQHVEDSKVKQKLAGNKFNHIVEEISEALIHGNLHPQSLVELLDDKRVFTFDDKGVTYGKPSVIKERIEHLVEKYTAKVTQREIFKDFTKQDALEVFNSLSEQERPLYTMLFKPGMLELAGADKAEVAADRERGARMLNDGALVPVLENLMDAGRHELARQGVKSEYIDDLEAMQREFRNALERGTAGEYMAQNTQETTDLLRNMAMSAKDPGAFWQEYVQNRSAEELGTRVPAQKRTSMQYAEPANVSSDTGIER